jgi:hypothetical protein
MSSALTWLADKFLDQRRRRTDVRLRVHRARLTILHGRPLATPVDAYFLNVWNASPERQVQVTHLYVETPDGQISVLTKPLPQTITAEHQWETWLPVAHVPAGVDVVEAARATLSTGAVIESEPRLDVPASGAVPDG